jgi:hypothetical protein
VKITMAQPRLFAWDRLQDSPSLSALREVLESIPDEELLATLRTHRAKGRNDYPVRVLWGVLLLTTALRHTTIKGCLDELRRNADLRRLIGIESEEGVPQSHNISRFQAVLGREPFLSLFRRCFDQMLGRLAETVPDLGRSTAGDSTALNARASRSAELKEELREGIPQPEGGHKEYVDKEGRTTCVYQWNGYKLHLLVDTRHEVILGYHTTGANQADCLALDPLLRSVLQVLPEGRIRTLSYDKAADSEAVHLLLADSGVAPVIELRNLWKDQPYRPLPGRDSEAFPRVLHDEAGTIYCLDTSSDTPVRRRMSYHGYEANRGTLKYRCPAMQNNWTCPSERNCNCGSIYGATIRVRRELDLRRFPPIPRATQTFERIYKKRTAVERVNARIKLYWGADDGNVTGGRRFLANVATVMIVHLAFATVLARASGRTGTLGHTRLEAARRALAGNGTSD